MRRHDALSDGAFEQYWNCAHPENTEWLDFYERSDASRRAAPRLEEADPPSILAETEATLLASLGAPSPSGTNRTLRSPPPLSPPSAETF